MKISSSRIVLLVLFLVLLALLGWNLLKPGSVLSSGSLALASNGKKISVRQGDAISDAEEPDQLTITKSDSKALREAAEKKKLERQHKERKDCILNQRNLQQVIRGHQNIHSLPIGAEIDWKDLIGPGKYLDKMPECACGKPYVLPNKIPPIGELIATCPEVTAAGKHEPEDFKQW